MWFYSSHSQKGIYLNILTAIKSWLCISKILQWVNTWQNNPFQLQMDFRQLISSQLEGELKQFSLIKNSKILLHLKFIIHVINVFWLMLKLSNFHLCFFDISVFNWKYFVIVYLYHKSSNHIKILLKLFLSKKSIWWWLQWI